MKAAEIARALRGKPYRGGEAFLVRCVVHEDSSPSLIISDGHDGTLKVNCMAGCEWRDVRDEFRRRGWIESAPNRAEFAQFRTPLPPKPERTHPVWPAARSISCAAAETYLRSRLLDSCDRHSLRFQERARHASGVMMPAMVAAIQSPSGVVIAVQLTFLDHTGRKTTLDPVRQIFGEMGTGAVRFAPAEEITGLAEGAETAMAAQQMTGVPVWASLGAARMHRVTLPDAVKEVHIFTDNDTPGITAADRTSKVHTDFGRRVVIRRPPDGCKDWNDFLIAKMPAAA